MQWHLKARYHHESAMFHSTLRDFDIQSVGRIPGLGIAIPLRQETQPDQKYIEGIFIGLPVSTGQMLAGWKHGNRFWSNQSDVFYSAGEEFAPSL
jgi:hypothetical protein